MSLRLTLSCDGHRNGMDCRGARSSSLGMSSTRTRDEDALHALAAARKLDDGGWRLMPDGRDLCPSGGHDEDVTSS
jgi:hypothetical protein